MALEVKTQFLIGPASISVSDITGTYDALNNPGGYGAPNEAFADFAHYALLKKKNVNNVADQFLAITPYDPILATEFTAARTVDGHYSSYKLNIPLWDAGENNTAGQVRYDGGIIYRAKQDGINQPPISEPDYWEVITDLASLVDDVNENIDQDSYITTKGDTVSIFNADVYWSRQYAANSQKGKCGVCDNDRERQRLDDIEFHINAAIVACSQGNYIDGEWNVQSLLKLGAK